MTVQCTVVASLRYRPTRTVPCDLGQDVYKVERQQHEFIAPCIIQRQVTVRGASRWSKLTKPKGGIVRPCHSDGHEHCQ